MCTPCALRQKIGFIKKTEELVGFFGPVVSGHWVMWRDGEGLGLEDGGSWSETEWIGQHPHAGAHHSHWHASHRAHCFLRLRSFTARTDCACDWERQSLMTVFRQVWGRGVVALGYSARMHISQCDSLLLFTTVCTGSHESTSNRYCCSIHNYT